MARPELGTVGHRREKTGSGGAGGMKGAGRKLALRGSRKTAQRSANARLERLRWFGVGREDLLSVQLTSLCS